MTSLELWERYCNEGSGTPDRKGELMGKKTTLKRAELPGFRGWVIRDVGGQYIGLDHGSGGYPYHAEGIRDIFVWNTKEDAEKYRQVFVRGSSIGGMSPASTWRIVEVMLIEVPREEK